MPSTRINNNNLHALLAKLVDSLFSDHDRVRLGVRTVVRNLGLGRVLLELVKRACSEGVGADERGPEAFAGVVGCELYEARGSGRARVRQYEIQRTGEAARVETDLGARRRLSGSLFDTKSRTGGSVGESLRGSERAISVVPSSCPSSINASALVGPGCPLPTLLPHTRRPCRTLAPHPPPFSVQKLQPKPPPPRLETVDSHRAPLPQPYPFVA